MSNLSRISDHTFDVSLAEERRSAERHATSRACYVKPSGKNAGVAWGVRLSDISQSGLSIVLRVRLEPGTVLAVQPSRQALQQPLFARVVRADRHEHGWLYGCEFLRPVDDDELRRWLED